MTLFRSFCPFLCLSVFSCLPSLALALPGEGFLPDGRVVFVGMQQYEPADTLLGNYCDVWRYVTTYDTISAYPLDQRVSLLVSFVPCDSSRSHELLWVSLVNSSLDRIYPNSNFVLSRLDGSAWTSIYSCGEEDVCITGNDTYALESRVVNCYDLTKMFGGASLAPGSYKLSRSYVVKRWVSDAESRVWVESNVFSVR